MLAVLPGSEELLNEGVRHGVGAGVVNRCPPVERGAVCGDHRGVNVLFLQEKAIDESLALCEVASWLRARGHHCSLLLEREETDLWGEARAASPDVVVIPASVVNHPWTRATAREARRRLGVPIVATGTAPTLHPDGLRSAELDYLVRGEAEGPLAGLLEVLDGGGDTGSVPGLWVKEGPELSGTDAEAPVDVATLPAPDRDLYFERYPWFGRFPWKKFLGSRGCFHRCTYCYIPSLNDIPPRAPRIRRKDPEALVEEVVREKRRAPLHHVHFSDDIFRLESCLSAGCSPGHLHHRSHDLSRRRGHRCRCLRRGRDGLTPAFDRMQERPLGNVSRRPFGVWGSAGWTRCRGMVDLGGGARLRPVSRRGWVTGSSAGIRSVQMRSVRPLVMYQR